jgi:hypothetical protein
VTAGYNRFEYATDVGQGDYYGKRRQGVRSGRKEIRGNPHQSSQAPRRESNRDEPEEGQNHHHGHAGTQ